MGCDHINALYKFTITYLLTYLLTLGQIWKAVCGCNALQSSEDLLRHSAYFEKKFVVEFDVLIAELSSLALRRRYILEIQELFKN